MANIAKTSSVIMTELHVLEMAAKIMVTNGHRRKDKGSCHGRVGQESRLMWVEEWKTSLQVVAA
jgi:hypothetical protein